MLDLSKTSVEEMPSSIGCLINLTALTLRYCVNLVHLPSTICSLKLLKSLDLFGCLKFDNLSENIGNMEGLELLNLCWTAIKEVPSSIVLLKISSSFISMDGSYLNFIPSQQVLSRWNHYGFHYLACQQVLPRKEYYCLHLYILHCK